MAEVQGMTVDELRKRQAFLLDLVRRQREAEDADAVMRLSADAIGTFLQVDRSGFYEVMSPDELRFRACWTNGNLAPFDGTFEPRKMGHGYQERLRLGQTLCISDVETNPLTSDGAFAKVGSQAVIGVPIMRAGNWRAGVYVNSASKRAWTGDDVALLEEVADLSWDAVERARSTQALRQSEKRFRFLTDLDEATRNVFNPEEVMSVTAEQLGRYLDVSRCAYAEVYDDSDTFTILHDYCVPGTGSTVGRYSLQLFGSLAIRNMRGGQTLIVNDVSTELASGDGVEMFHAIGIEAIVCCPLVKDGHLKAMMAVHNAEARRWTDDDIKLVEAVVERCWAHIERIRADKELRELNANLQQEVIERSTVGGQFWQTSPDLLCTLNQWGQFTNVNAATWTRILGYAEDDILNISFRDLLHPDDVDDTAKAFEGLMAGYAIRSYENRFITKDGGFVWLDWTAAPHSGNFFCAGRDVTEDKLRQEKLEERTAERDLLARMVETTNSFIQVLDLDFNFLAINRANVEEYDRIFGLRPKVGDNLLKLLADRPEHQAAITEVWRPAMEGRAHSNVQEFGDPVFGRRQYEMRFEVLRDAEGRQTGAFLLGYDITDRVLAEQRLAAAQDQLRQAQKMESIGQLTGGIAHDFNNMLAVVQGSLELLNRRIGSDDPRSKRYIEAALDGAKRSSSLTQRLLAFSRQQPLRPETLDPNRLVAGMSDLLAHSIGADIRLETVLTTGPWRIHTDPNQLEAIILNLAVNARDAMPDGGRLTIETQNCHLDGRQVSLEPGMQAGEYFMIAVTDTGAGMPPHVLEKAFDPFFTTKAVGKGTGLGLSQVYGFVKQSGGYVKIHSEVGHGTSVKLYLPRDLNAGEIATDAVSQDPVLSERQELILVVDDEPAVRQFSTDVLTELGYSVLSADGALKAMELLAERADIAMMFTDIVMPDVNGRVLADQAKALRPELKVLFTTGYSKNAVVHNGIVDAGVELITKPFSIEELAAKVRTVLDGAG